MKGNAAQSVNLLLIGGDYAALITYVCELKKIQFKLLSCCERNMNSNSVIDNMLLLIWGDYAALIAYVNT